MLNPPKVKLPDAGIAATAEVWNIPIVTRNPKDFQSLAVPVHVPCDLDASNSTVPDVRVHDVPGNPVTIRLK